MVEREENLGAVAERAVIGLSVRRLVEAVTFFMRRARWGWRAFVFCGLMLGISVGAGEATGEAPALAGVMAWAAALLLVALLVYERLGRRVVETLRNDIGPGLTDEVTRRAAEVAARSPILRWQTAISAGIGGLTALLLGPALVGTFGRAPATLAVVIVGSALTTNYVYVPAMVSVLALLLAGEAVPVFPLDPLLSQMVRGMERIGREIVWTTAALATVGVVGPLLIPGLGIVGLVLALLVFCGAVLATGLQYVVQVIAINRLVGDRRDTTLNTLQRELDAYYERRGSLETADAARASVLLAMHEQAGQARENALSFSEAVGFLSPLVVPLIGLLVGSLNLPWLNEGLIGALIEAFF